LKDITLLLISGMTLLMTLQLAAQREGDRREQLVQMKIAYPTKNMDLITADAQRF